MLIKEIGCVDVHLFEQNIYQFPNTVVYVEHLDSKSVLTN